MRNRVLSEDEIKLKNSTLHPSANIQTLNEVRNRMSLHIPFKQNRQSMLNLYTGSAQESWFQNEVSECFSILTEHKSGIKFIYDVACKSKTFTPLFIKYALDYRSVLFCDPFGELLFAIIVPFLSESTQLSIFYEIYPKLFMKSSESFRKFANVLIWNSATNNGVQKMLSSVNWESFHNYLEYLRSLIEGSSQENAKRIIQSIPIPKTIQYAAALGHLITQFSPNAISLFMEQFKPQFVTFFLSPIAYPVAQGMISACKLSELRELALLVDDEMPQSYPGHFDVVLPSLLAALPFADRQQLLERWEARLYSSRFPLISRMYSYNKIMLQRQAVESVESD